MKKPYYKELPLFHVYDSNLTGSQKLLMTLLLIDDTYDIDTLSCLAKQRSEDVIFDLQELKKRGYFQDALLGRYVPSVEAMQAKLKKYDKLYTELTEENAALEKKLDSSSRESIQKKLEIQRKLSELDELRRTVDAIPDEVIRDYTAQKYVHHGRMNQEI